LNIKHAIESLKNNYLYCNKLNSNDEDDHHHTKQLKSALDGNSNSNTNSNVPDPLDSALLDMCKHLEVCYYYYYLYFSCYYNYHYNYHYNYNQNYNFKDENIKLHQTIQSLQEELQLSQRESSLSKLIPHYRLAIIRSKSQLVQGIITITIVVIIFGFVIVIT
jgi:hypothetical protein